MKLEFKKPQNSTTGPPGLNGIRLSQQQQQQQQKKKTHRIQNLNKEEESKVLSKNTIRQQSQNNGETHTVTRAIFGKAWVRVHNLSILWPHNKFQPKISINASKICQRTLKKKKKKPFTSNFSRPKIS